MSDLICRQAAIDALNDIASELHERGRLDEEYIASWCAEKVEQLPPIQPEIVRCKDCEHGVLDDGFPHQYFCVFKGDEWNNADYFCGHAKRREVTT